jgi:hypothetical protein
MRPPANRKPAPAATRVIATSISAIATIRPADDGSLAGSNPPGATCGRSMRSVC